jgi:hypothetical protein
MAIKQQSLPRGELQMGKPKHAIGNWTLFDPDPDNNTDSDNAVVAEVLKKLTNTHKKVHYYRKLSTKHLKKFMKNQPQDIPTSADPHPAGPKSWRAVLYQHAQLNAVFFMRRHSVSDLPTYCMTLSPVGTGFTSTYSVLLTELNALAWGFQQYNLDENNMPLPLEILSTHNKTVRISDDPVVDVDNCPTDDLALATLYREAVQASRITYEDLVEPDDPSYVDNGDGDLYRWLLHPVHP